MFARQRMQPEFSALAQQSSDKAENFLPATSDADTINISENHFNFRFDFNQNRKSFTSFAGKFGPANVNGDMMTNLQQCNFSDPLLTTNETTSTGMDVTGYGARKNFTQPFPAENIVMSRSPPADAPAPRKSRPSAGQKERKVLGSIMVHPISVLPPEPREQHNSRRNHSLEFSYRPSSKSEPRQWTEFLGPDTVGKCEGRCTCSVCSRNS
jgi:hypothetical protein